MTSISKNVYIGIENNKEDPKFGFGYHVRISKYKNIFTKDYILNWHEEVFVIKV